MRQKRYKVREIKDCLDKYFFRRLARKNFRINFLRSSTAGGEIMKPSKILVSFFVPIFITTILFMASCGGDVIPAALSGDLDNARANEGSPITTSGMTDKAYSGKVVIKFKNGTGVRLLTDHESQVTSHDSEGPFISTDNDSPEEGYEIGRVNELIRREPVIPAVVSGDPENTIVDTRSPITTSGMTDESQVTAVRRASQASEEEVTDWREYWAGRGVETHDWNRVYVLEVPDEEDAVALVAELSCHPCGSQHDSPPPAEGSPEYNCIREIPDYCLGDDNIVEYAEILPVYYLSNVVTPDLSGQQGYLRSVSEGGLDIEAAWAKLDEYFPDTKLRGQNVTVVDQEYDWNFDHEILPIDETAEFIEAYGDWTTLGISHGKGIANNIHHGTAVLGIIAGQGADINMSIKGLAPGSRVTTASISANGLLGLGSLGAEDGCLPSAGTIFTIEVQQRGVTTVTSGCTVGDGTSSPVVTGCVPLEAGNFLYNAIKDSTSTGWIIVEGAGNGSVDLNDDEFAAPEYENTFSHFNKVVNGEPVNDSGAIMVGASLGADKKKAPWSNCGDRVDVFAWGSGVVTAGYGDHPSSTGDISDPDNPTSYTAQFGGTSAATAQITGIAALVQSYVRKIFEDAGYVGRTAYLDAKQMRQILKSAGTPAVYGQTEGDPNPNCNIGVQPSALLAIDKVNEFLNGGAVLNVALLTNKVVSGIRYDMDGDKRAELISFSKDHKWYIDLSSVGNGGDNFGEWDLVFDASPVIQDPSSMLFPVVHDYNSDGRADLALYDSINGKFYIKYTTDSVIPAAVGSAPPNGWGGDLPVALFFDRVIDYSSDPLFKPYSRPIPGDINNDMWLDISFQTPDGHWLVDYGGMDGVKVLVDPATAQLLSVQYLDTFGAIDKDVKYLSDAQLEEAPGWAWFATLGGFFHKYLLSKAPDGTNKSNYLYYTYINNGDGTYGTQEINKYVSQFGSSDSYLTMAGFTSSNDLDQYGFKSPDGQWSYLDGINWKYEPLISPEPQGFGDVLCRPIPADYDGDGKDDRAVQCETTWKIAYSSKPGVMEEIELSDVIDPLPAYVYPGGIKYQDQTALFNYYKTELPCDDGQICDEVSTIFDVQPPIGPYFAECVKNWMPKASECWE